ncbi:MAG: anti-sigma factor RsiW, partial [Myxococcota bacterium]
MDSFFTHDGHLLDLTLERLVAGEIPPADLSEHLDACAACTQRHASLLADNAVALPPLRRLKLVESVSVAPASPLLTRDSHLTDLTLERLVDGELTGGEASAHLAACEACTARHAAILADSAAALPPLRLSTPASVAAPDNVIPFSRQRSWWSGAGGLLAAAAAVLLLVNISPTEPLPERNPEENFTIRGDDLPKLDLEVYRSASGGITRISSDDVVHPGDRLGFRIGSETDGHLLILG